MGVYIKNWSLADWKEILKWAKIGTNNAMIGEFTEVEEVPPHGRLIDADALCDLLMNLADNDYTPKVFASYLSYEENAPTIIESEEGE